MEASNTIQKVMKDTGIIKQEQILNYECGIELTLRRRMYENQSAVCLPLTFLSVRMAVQLRLFSLI